jgi:hypothetical protein
MKDTDSHPRQRRGNLHFALLYGYSARWQPWLLRVRVRKSFSILGVQNLNSVAVLCFCNFKSYSYVSKVKVTVAKKKNLSS